VLLANVDEAGKSLETCYVYLIVFTWLYCWSTK